MEKRLRFGRIPGYPAKDTITWKPMDFYVFWVKNLVGKGGKWWNLDLIKYTFNPYDRERIMQIPTNNQNETNTLIWMASKRGEYTVKIGYHWMKDNIKSDEPEQSNKKNDRNIWNKFLKIQTIP